MKNFDLAKIKRCDSYLDMAIRSIYNADTKEALQNLEHLSKELRSIEANKFDGEACDISLGLYPDFVSFQYAKLTVNDYLVKVYIDDCSSIDKNFENNIEKIKLEFSRIINENNSCDLIFDTYIDGVGINVHCCHITELQIYIN